MTSNKEQTGLQRGIIISSTVITIVVVAAAYLLHRAQNKRVTKLIEKIEVIQANQDNAFAQLDSSLFNKQINELQANRLKLQEERFKLEVGKQKQELFWHIVGVLGIGTVAGFFAFLFFVPNEVRQRTRDEIDLQIAPLVNDQKEILKRVLHKYGEEDRLERSKKIGVKGKLNSTITDSILRRQYGLTIIEDEQELSTCDVIIISGEDVKLKALDLRKEKLDTPDDINKYIYRQKIT